VTDEPDFVVIGQVRRAHGTGGEVVIEPVSGTFERFRDLKRVLVRDKDGIRETSVTSVRKKGDLVVAKIEGIDDRASAQALASAELGVKRQDVWPLPEGSYYIFDVVGSKVVATDGREIGTVEDVLGMPANDVLVVRTDKGEALLPVTKNVVKKIDVKAKTVVIEEIEGLLG
jgi:16S rRNA processing protein RimM